MGNVSITLGNICSYGEIHDWLVMEWQIIPDLRGGMEQCSYSLQLTWNLVPIFLVIILIIVLVIFVRKKNNRSKDFDKAR